MTKKILSPDTTLYPVPVVLVTCGPGDASNVFTVNRIASCNAEPPMICVSVRPNRASHDLIETFGEFGVNIPFPDMEPYSDFFGTTTARETNKWSETALTPFPAGRIEAALIAECPVNLECRVTETLRLPSHTLFIAEILVMHADQAVLNNRDEVDFEKACGGLVYGAAVVRERPVANFKPEELLSRVRAKKGG